MIDDVLYDSQEFVNYFKEHIENGVYPSKIKRNDILTKDILKDYQGLLLEEKQLQEQLEIWEAKAESSRGNLDGMPRGSGTSDPTSRYAIKITEINDMLTLKMLEIIDEFTRIENAIEMLDRPHQRYVLREYYINNKTIEDIAMKMQIEVRSVYRIHLQALENIVL